MKDKFIMMDLNDERSKKISQILGNKTSKKIIDFLADTKEASEKDISDRLNIPLNTIEYSLKKLLEVGLVEKTKNFFWSKKGKKISMYKMANKHIVISPKSTKPSLTSLKTIIPIITVIAIIALLFYFLPVKNIKPEDIDQSTLKTFNSQAELEEFLEENQAQDSFFGVTRDFATAESGIATAGTAEAAGSTQKASDYSETNIQVEGVDEPDIVKNDGKYIYVVSGQSIVIVNAYPAENMEILSEINISGVRDIFINEDRLIVFIQDYNDWSKTKTNIYDISDRDNPKLEKEIEIDGNYVTARMINDNVYLIANQYIGFSDIVLPRVMVDGVREEIAVSDIAYFPYPDTSYTFTNILAIDINDGNFESQTYLTGASHTVYVSEDNIYLTYSKRISQKVYFEEVVEEVIIPLVPSNIRNKIKDILKSDKDDWEKQREIGELVEDYSQSLRGSEKAEFDKELVEKMQDFSIKLQKTLELTIVHKININGLDINYVTNGEVPGRILNQFSMDEYKGNFRIATTTGDTWGSANSLNHLYVLDENLEIIGSVEDLAKGERIYSVRFIGDRAYVVTFRQVDPLFVIDLSSPKNPEVLGQLKVTGYSSYLHPYDENHIIGIGKEATEQGRVTGVKIALFDVSDVENPIEKAKYEVQGEWSDSNALYDHKAFLFDKDRELLVLPMSYSEESTNSEGLREYDYWQGAFVFKINKNEISLRGKIDHKENNSEQGYYYGPYAIQRSLYMDDILYTISRTLIKANELDDLSEIAKTELPYEEEYYYYRSIPGGGDIDVPMIDAEAVVE